MEDFNVNVNKKIHQHQVKGEEGKVGARVRGRFIMIGPDRDQFSSLVQSGSWRLMLIPKITDWFIPFIPS